MQRYSVEDFKDTMREFCNQDDGATLPGKSSTSRKKLDLYQRLSLGDSEMSAALFKFRDARTFPVTYCTLHGSRCIL
jgi:hypothetical protein